MAKAPLWYRWAVNYRDKRGRIRQVLIDAPSHRDAIAAASVAHPAGRDFAATKLSTKPIE